MLKKALLPGARGVLRVVGCFEIFLRRFRAMGGASGLGFEVAFALPDTSRLHFECRVWGVGFRRRDPAFRSLAKGP